MAKIDPAPPVNCRYGAPMGRPNMGADFNWTLPLHLQRLNLDSGGYDHGGAYWGPGAPIYAIFDDAGFYCTLRAWSRDAAKAEFRADQPHAWFYGERDPVRIYDNGGRTFDRYTAVYRDQPEHGGCFAARGMSANPFHPQGFGQMGAAMDGSHLGKRIRFDDLPTDCARLVYQDRAGA